MEHTLFKNKKVKNILRFVITPLCIIALLAGSFLFFRDGSQVAEAAWYNSSWDYRVKVTIDAAQVVDTTASTTVTLTSGSTWVVPDDWGPSSTIEVIGGGGGGATGSGGRAGGGGGAYSKIKNTVELTAGESVTYAIGSGGAAGSDGGNTYFCSGTSNCTSLSDTAVIVGARPGGAGSSGTGGGGASTGAGVGTTKSAGGDGGDASGAGGAGGGGAGGRNGNGQSAGNTGRDEGSGGGGNGGGGNGRNANADGGCTLGCGGTGGQIFGYSFSSCKGTGQSAGGSGCMGDGSRGGNGANGGGGGGGDDDTSGWRGGHGGAGIDLGGTIGSGGGGGGAGQDGSTGNVGGNGGLYGGGGGGASGSSASGPGGQGVIYIEYIPAVLSDFPVYVDLADLPQHVWNNMRSDCGDIRITTSDGATELPRELVACSNASSTGELHFKAPDLSTVADTVFYIYYGNAAEADYADTATYGAEKVWTNGYLGVWHLGEDGNTTAGGYIDSTSKRNHGTGTSMTASSDVVGQVGYSQDFDGSADRIVIPRNTKLEPTAELTLSAWVRPDGAQGASAKPVFYGDNSGTPDGPYGFALNSTSDTDIRFKISSAAKSYHATGTAAVSNGTWSFLTGTYDGATQTLYKNATSLASLTFAITIGDYATYGLGIGDKAQTGQPWGGPVDEVRIASSSRSVSWIGTEYNNQSSPSTFYVIGESSASAPVVETFTTSDTWVVPAGVTEVEVLVVGGGGGGGPADSNTRSGGGGGAGGVVYDASYTVTPGASMSITIGAGGIGAGLCCAGSQVATGRNGSSTIFGSITAVGGGGGGNGGAGAGADGGSGGGAGRNNTTSAVGTVGQGNNGGAGSGGGSAATEGAGGGGGAGAVGSAGTSAVGGNGGVGLAYDISGVSTYYGGGGGGARYNGSSGTGGLGGGGNGTSVGAGVAGTANRGGGGGGASGTANGGSGGSGIVIIKYTAAPPSAPDTPVFSVLPTNASSTAITMSATTTDNGENIETETAEYFEYYFAINNTSCGANAGTGGTDSGWIATSTYVDAGLQPNKCYGYTITARDGLGYTSATSTASTTYTAATPPGGPRFTSLTTNSAELIHTAATNPTSSPTTYFAVQASSTDAAWDGKYVDADGNASVSAVWLTDSDLDGITIDGLDNTDGYDFRSKARNELTAESAFGAWGSIEWDVLLKYEFHEESLSPTIESVSIAGNIIANDQSLATWEFPAYYDYATAPVLRLGSETGATTSALAISTNSYFTITITPQNDRVLNFDSLTFQIGRGGATTPRGWVVRSSADSYASNVGTADVTALRPSLELATVDLSGGSFQTISTPITFRIYTYSPTAGSSLEIDDITFYGEGIGDTVPPNPNPGNFSVPPDDVSSTSIDMTATSGTDPEAHTPISYLFTNNNTACGANAGTGGSPSNWQTSTSYTDTGLHPNKCYGYTTTMRDALSNAGSASAASTTYTAAAVPGLVTFGAVGMYDFTITNDANGNPTSSPVTTFAVQVSATSPSDATWDGKYIDASGNPTTTTVWLTDSQIDSLTLDDFNLETTYTLRSKARNYLNEETAFGSTNATSTLPDVLPPTPNPATFSSAPNNTSDTAIAMTATAGSDADGATPIEYLFTNDNDSCGADAGTGGTTSSWQTSVSYTDTGLQANRCYGYSVTMRDALGNTGGVSTVSTTYTSAAVPGAVDFIAVGETTAQLYNTENGNPDSTEFALQMNVTTPSDATWLNKYVDADGNPSDTVVWLTDDELDGLVLHGLEAGTYYEARAKARNADSEETAWGSNGEVTTVTWASTTVQFLGGTRLQDVNLR